MAFKSTLSSQNQPAVHAGWFGACNPVYNGVRFQFWPVATKLRARSHWAGEGFSFSGNPTWHGYAASPVSPRRSPFSGF